MKTPLLISVLATSCIGVDERCTTVEEITTYTVCRVEGGPQVVLWPTFPLRVQTKDPRLSQRVVEASTRWNDDTGLEIFTFDPACATCPVIEIEEVSAERSALLRESHGADIVATAAPIHDPHDCDYYRGKIQLLSGPKGFRALTDAQQVDTLQHELGHILGLHDDAPSERTLMTAEGVELGCGASFGHIEFVQEQYGISLERDRLPQFTRSPSFSSSNGFLQSGGD